MSNSYDEYLKTLHSKSGVSKVTLERICKEATGANICKIKRMMAGEVNEVYDVEVSNGQSIIVRISRNGIEEFIREDWAMKKARGAGVLVADNIVIKTIDGSEGLAVCVQKKLPGSPLERGEVNIFDLGESERMRITIQSGEVLAKIHSVAVGGFGELDGNGMGGFKTYKQLLSDEIENGDHYLKMAKATGMDEEKMKYILKLMEDWIERQTDFDTVLNHGDFGPKHLMYQDNNIVGVLDWGQANGNTYDGDLVWWDFWYGKGLPLSWLLKGYGGVKVDFERLEVLKLHKGLSAMGWYWENKYKDGVEMIKQKFDEGLKKLA